MPHVLSFGHFFRIMKKLTSFPHPFMAPENMPTSPELSELEGQPFPEGKEDLVREAEESKERIDAIVARVDTVIEELKTQMEQQKDLQEAMRGAAKEQKVLAA